MENPYKHTLTEGEETPRRSGRQQAGRFLAIAGALLQLGIVVSFFSAIGIVFTDGLDDPENPSGAPHGYITSILMIGFVAAFVGLILLMIALLATRYRARWFFWFLMTYGILLTIAMPLIPFGIVFIVYCLVRRTDFFPRARPEFFRERRREG